MGIALLSRLARAPGMPPATARRYVDFIAAQLLSFAGYMQDASSGLYRHGYNHQSGDLSCCFWGRANGWIMMAHAEVAEAVAAVAPAHPQLPALLDIWRRHAAGLAAVQSAGDGRFHQVLDAPSTYLETSVTAMTVYSLVAGVLGGWLDRATFAPVIDAAWAGVAGAVAADGTVNDICTGTGIGSDVAFYEARPTAYNVSAPGIGSVFRAAVAYSSWLAS
jgi:rhamnogalacturonyl hydrolase YesR